MSKLVIIVIGHRNSGKSTTWYDLFGWKVRTGTELKTLHLTETEYVEAFLVSGSPEERQKYVGDIIGNQKPHIVLCSAQYIANVTTTIDYFVDNGYSIFAHWLNPGHHDGNEMYFDSQGLMSYLLAKGATVAIRNGKTVTTERVREIKDYLYGWAKSRKLLLQ